MESDAKAFDEEAKRMKAKKDKLEKNIDRMKKTVFESLQAMGKREAGGKVLKAKLRMNGGVLPLVLDAAPDDLPFEYQICHVEADNKAIREALDKGVELNFAHYGERGESLQIK